MERFSYSHDGYIPVDRRALLAHLNATIDEPVIGVMTDTGEHDIVAFTGVNKGVTPETIATYDVYDKQTQRVWSRSFAEDTPIAGREEITVYVSHKLKDWREDSSSPSRLLLTLTLLSAAKQTDCMPNTIDYDNELADIWQAIQALTHSAKSGQELDDVARACLESELAPRLEEYARSIVASVSSLEQLYANPLVASYIGALQGGRPNLDDELAIISALRTPRPLET